MFKGKFQGIGIEFGIPLWVLEGDLLEGSLKWALDFRDKNPDGVQMSNQGGYHSRDIQDEFPFYDHLRARIQSLPQCKVVASWININSRGDHNSIHTHPTPPTPQQKNG